MQELQLQKRRQCGPKVKSGCVTCKIRRIKCDEAKPSCKRCTSTGRKCDGYNSEHFESEKALKRIPRISVHLPGNPEERRGFQFFLKNTAAELSGYYDKTFWESLLLQASSSEPSLRHAIIAIGSLHEDFSHRRLKYSSGNSGFAIKQYTKAIGHLRRSLATGTHSPLTALISCILFVCFDSLRGYFTGAMVHLQSGLKILQDLRENGITEDDIIERTIAPIFTRLGVQSILYIDTRGNSDRLAFATTFTKCLKDRQIPETFENLEEARNSMNQAADGLFRMLYMCDGDLPCCFQPVEAFELYDKYSAQLQQWNTAFDKYMSTKSQDFDSKQLRGAALLKIQHTTVNIISAAAKPDMEDLRSVTESVNSPDRFISFDRDFRSVVNLARSLITGSEVDAKSGKSSLTFSTDMGVIAPLYYVATHCCDTSIREESINLLSRCPRREGMWDGEAVSKMVREFWQIERAHLGLRQLANEKEGLLSLNEIVDLEILDGMIWEWKWKTPYANAGRSASSTPECVWTDQLIKEGPYESSS